MPSQKVGVVQGLNRYLVKSMAAESLRSSAVSWHGLAGDRRWAFVRPGMERSGFPWLTIREKPDLWRYEPYLVDPTDMEGSRTKVKTPDGDELEVTDPVLAQRLGEGVRVMKQYSGIFDTFPLSFLTVQSVKGLSDLVGARPNATSFSSEHPDQHRRIGSVFGRWMGWRNTTDRRAALQARQARQAMRDSQRRPAEHCRQQPRDTSRDCKGARRALRHVRFHIRTRGSDCRGSRLS